MFRGNKEKKKLLDKSPAPFLTRTLNGLKKCSGRHPSMNLVIKPRLAPYSLSITVLENNLMKDPEIFNLLADTFRYLLKNVLVFQQVHYAMQSNKVLLHFGLMDKVSNYFLTYEDHTCALLV
ncbi:hypothetical protein ILYODFUR_009787 [Ilyodon furcidens]|uniref:Uncharacterized protein n=1 Tax=Ilyodon furcidens TaxID=33524 RepID=A0ABV0U5X2_9TELE